MTMRSKQWYTKTSRLPNSRVNRSIGCHSTRSGEGSLSQKRIKRRLGKQQVEGKDFRLLDEVRYIQQRAAVHDGRLVTLGQLILFSTETGDCGLLDTEDRLATPSCAMRVARRSSVSNSHASHRMAFLSRSI